MPRSKPESGNPTFRDCRGARGNVTLSFKTKGARLGSIPTPGTRFAPPGSNQSGGGGNEAVGASGVEGHIGDLASMKAVTRENAEPASKRLTQEPTRRVIGRAAADGTVRANQDHQTCRGNGDGKQARLTSSNTGNPSGDRSGDQ